MAVQIDVEAPLPTPATLRRRAGDARLPVVEYLTAIVARTTSIDAAAAEADVSRQTFRRWLQRYGIRVVRR